MGIKISHIHIHFNSVARTWMQLHKALEELSTSNPGQLARQVLEWRRHTIHTPVKPFCLIGVFKADTHPSSHWGAVRWVHYIKLPPAGFSLSNEGGRELMEVWLVLTKAWFTTCTIRLGIQLWAWWRTRPGEGPGKRANLEFGFVARSVC